LEFFGKEWAQLRKKCAAVRTDFGHTLNPTMSRLPFSLLRPASPGLSSSLSLAFTPLGLLRVVLLALPLAAGACREGKIEDYRIAKETDAPAPAAGQAAAAMPPAGAPGADHTAPFLTSRPGTALVWTAPAAWKKKQNSSMRKGSYTVGEEGTGADMAITAFPGDVGGDLANVNRWRGQVGLAPIADSELTRALTPLEANGLKIAYVDLLGGTPEQPVRMLGALVPFDGSTWFFKLTGPAALVEKEKPAYLKLLGSVKAGAAPAAEAAAPAAAGPTPPAADMASTAVPTAGGPGLKWVAPANWQSKPASGMRKATFIAAGDAGTFAELSVTAFPGAVGGELANLNRWRGQLSLPPLAEAELAGAITRETVHGLSVTLVDITGGPADKPVRLLGAIVPSNGANWFFKFTGPPPVVAKEQAAFLEFIRSLQAP
jgi:hypothetical protein